DNGCLTDSNGKKVDFRNVIMVMTTNAGASDAQKEAIGFGRGRKDDEADKAVERLFTPEFRNRLDAIIPFAPLRPEVIARVVEKFVLQLEAQLTDRGISFELTADATAWLADRGYDSRFGARPLGRVIQEHIKKPLADQILFGELKKGGLVKVDVDAADPDKLDFHITPADRLLPVKAKGKKPKGKKGKKEQV
ncbi:MAG: AAA family ATPase, partial [Maricaulis sp.]|nr:AAA family ATPase [Maricaulis sp.]